MKKKLLVLPVLAALLVACTGDELVVSANQGQQTEEDGAIAFDAYLNRTVTRAGLVGEITSTELQSSAGGFGVFAYYADGDLYSENAIPNFMYNQEVKYSTDHWEYSPIKYWPNEFGSTAVSTGVDRVTFFAYAPYVGVDPTTGQLTGYYDGTTDARSPETGITALTRNGKAGDPYVRYVGAFDPAKCVDLCYGVAADKYDSSVDAFDGANDIRAGDPYINVAKPASGSKLKFNFKHALAQLRVNVDADVDILSHSETDVLEGKTHVWVRSITFDGVAQRGYLNMNTGVWYETIDNNKISHASVTVHDGRRDGAEALADDSYETPIGFNPALVQSGAYTTIPGFSTTGAPIYTGLSTSTTGVTTASLPLFGESAHNLLVVPANEQLRVTIVYDVETADATLPKFLSDGVTRGSTVENKITKFITLGGLPLKLEAGNAYTINLHLGMTGVKFEAEMSSWQNKGSVEDYLPANLPVYKAAAPGAADITVPATATACQFGVIGLTGGETVESTNNSPVTGAPVENGAASANGVAIVNATITPNGTVKNVTTDNAITVRGSSSGKSLVVRLIQKAAPLGLSVASTAISGSPDIVLSASVVDGWGTYVATPDNTDESSIIVYKNGTRLTYASSSPTTGQFTWEAASHKIELGENATTGDLYVITVTAGDAAAETISFIATAP